MLTAPVDRVGPGPGDAELDARQAGGAELLLDGGRRVAVVFPPPPPGVVRVGVRVRLPGPLRDHVVIVDIAGFPERARPAAGELSRLDHGASPNLRPVVAHGSRPGRKSVSRCRRRGGWPK